MPLTKDNKVIIVEQYAAQDDGCCCCRCDCGEKEYQVVTHESRQVLYRAQEHLDRCCRRCGCLCRRDFDLNMVDGEGKAIAVLHHGTMCCTWLHCLSCCRHRLDIKDASKKKLGRVENDCRICCSCYPRFSVYDEKDHELFKVVKDVQCCCGSCCPAKCCCCDCSVPTGYTVHGTGAAKGEEGKVERLEDTRARAGGGKEDTFILYFPPQAVQSQRLLLVATSILLDYTIYDEKPVAQKMKA